MPKPSTLALNHCAGHCTQTLQSLFDIFTVPRSHQAAVLAKTAANFVGSLSEKDWQAMNQPFEPCGAPGCDCHEAGNDYLQLLGRPRQRYLTNLARQHADQPFG